MDKNNRKLPTPEVINYGNEREVIGYQRGYTQCQNDIRKLKRLRSKSQFKRFCSYIDHLDDLLAANRKK